MKKALLIVILQLILFNIIKAESHLYNPTIKLGVAQEYDSMTDMISYIWNL